MNFNNITYAQWLDYILTNIEAPFKYKRPINKRMPIIKRATQDWMQVISCLVAPFSPAAKARFLEEQTKAWISFQIDLTIHCDDKGNPQKGGENES